MTVVDVTSLTLLAVGCVLLVPLVVLLVEVLASFARGRRPDSTPSTRPRIAVLVPAHDEALTIVDTVAHLLLELAERDRLVVVADNCADETATLARAAGAEVIVRTDALRRGKGYALDFGVRHLAADPPDVVVVVDADCRPEGNAVARIGSMAAECGRPVQAYYDIVAPNQARTPYLLMAGFAAKVKNLARPLGCHRLGLPCQLMGTGMAFPWSLIITSNLATSEIVEDLVYGLQFAQRGHPPLFCPEATVTSAFPAGQLGQNTQRARWETGHLNTIARLLPGYFVSAIRRGDLVLLALVLDAAVPPLSVLAISVTWLTILSLVLAVLSGATAALELMAGCGLIFTSAVLLAWWRVGRDVVSIYELAFAPAFVLSKLGLYGRVLVGRKLDWIRTRRDNH